MKQKFVFSATGPNNSLYGGFAFQRFKFKSTLFLRRARLGSSLHVPRKAILDGIKRALFALSSSSGEKAGEDDGGAKSEAASSGPDTTVVGCEGATLLVQGMGGSGKTVVASSLARDPEVGARFDTI